MGITIDVADPHRLPHQSLLEKQGFRVGFQYNVCTINQFPTYRLRIFVTGVSTEKALSDAGMEDILILYDGTIVQEGADHADKIDDLANVPTTAAEMAVDCYSYDYEFAVSPPLTSLQDAMALTTFNDFGEVMYFLANKRGYESVVHHTASPVP